jgi:flagella basal body P-ring formation protein FlgA
MRIILWIGLLLVGFGWWPDAGSVWATQPKSGGAVGQSVAAQDFERAIFSTLTRQYGRPNHRVKVRILFPKKPLTVQAGKLHLEVEKLAGGARTGRRSFRIGVFINGQFIKTINVVGEVKVQVPVTTPVRWIKPKEVVTAKDVMTMMVDVPSLTHDFILDSDDVIGKQVLRPLPPRKPIRKIMLDDPPVVHKGDRVMIEVRKGGLLVQVVGLAKADGKSGDTIPVQNKSSGREVVGTILSAGLVEVGF